MGGSPKRGGSHGGGGALMSRGRVVLVAVLALQLVLVLCLMKAPRLIWSSTRDEIDAPAELDEAAPTVNQGSWLWRKFRISTTAPNCTDADGRVVTEVVKGSAIKCSDRTSLLRMKWIDPKPKPIRDPKKREVTSSLATAAIAEDPALSEVNAATVFRNSHGANAGLREGRGRLREGQAGGDARDDLSVVGDLRQERVQVGRDLPATLDPDVASGFEEARGTKSASWRLEREFDENTRSSLERDSLRPHARTIGYGDQRQRSSGGYLRTREDENAREVIARFQPSNEIAAIAPGARIATNVSDTIAPAVANVSDSIAPAAEIRPSAVDSDEDEPEEEERDEEDPADVPVPRTKEGFYGRRESLPRFTSGNDSLEISPTRSNASLEISPTSTSLENSTRNISMAEKSTSNTSVDVLPNESTRITSMAEISSGNSSLAEILSTNTSVTEISTRNSSLAETLLGNTSLAEIPPRITSLAEILPRNTSLAEILPRNTSLADIQSNNTSLADILSGNTSLTEIPSGDVSFAEILSRNMSLDIPARTSTLNQTSDSFPRNSTSLEESEQVTRLLSAPSAAQNGTVGNATASLASNNGTCPLGLLYVYKLPQKFNTEFVENCSQLLGWVDRCEELSNSGLGPHLRSSPLPSLPNATSSGPWFATDHFNGEVIFHHRMLAHPCRTHNPELADAFFIPYYGGLDVDRVLLNVTTTNFTSADRDKLATELAAWLARSPYWKRRQGGDHFLFLGRTTRDFRRESSRGGRAGLSRVAELANVTKLALDAETAIPYPTAFHPRNDSELEDWQNEVRGRDRDLLFSVAGAKRKAFANAFRTALLEQCETAERCAVLDCSQGKCLDDALATTKLFMRSTFCLQPRGDSFSRRSLFDALVAGCIPVFFSIKSASVLQYPWHFPADPRAYSVLIPRQDVQAGVQIEEVLSSIPPALVRQLRRTVVEMIPRLVYAQAQGQGTHRDAFDTTIDQVMAKLQVRGIRNASDERAETGAPQVVNLKTVREARA